MGELRKGDILPDIFIESMASGGKCVARMNGRVIFVTGGAPGDVVDLAVTRIKPAFLEGRVTTVKKKSSSRIEPFCMHFGTCGGCSWQHIDYPTQLKYKQQQVIDNLERIGGFHLPEIQPILGSSNTKYYRNRLDYTFTSNRWLTVQEFVPGSGQEDPGLGYHMPSAHDRVFDVTECFLQPEPSNSIRLLVKETAIREGIPFFNIRRQTGFLRTLTIRTANTGETMIILQVTYDQMEWIEKILVAVAEKFRSVTSINYIINGKRNDTFHDLDIVCWKGSPWITEIMQRPDLRGKLSFRVGPKSFYQTNSEQAFQLYLAAWKMAELKGHETVYDLYTGTGTIANFIAAHAGKVIGLEYVEAAIEDAKINAELNKVTNAEFFSGDIRELLNESFLSAHGAPDVIITDPPRAGMHEDVCRMMLKAGPSRIVYVSCNPATQARDLKILSEKYELTTIQPVDMFPQTVHVENVVALRLRSA